MKKELTSLPSVKQLSHKIRAGVMSPVDLVEVCLERIKRFNPSLNAFITVLEESSYKDAEAAEQQIKQGLDLGPLHGIPFSIKDIFYVKGVRCTAGSKILSDYTPDFDATVVKKMKAGGAILIGTNNLNEFASGITGINPFYGSSKNPWNTSRISGGSSGGSAVAVATGMTPISLGSDTGGSIRVPASLCGLVGLKPTYGRISRHGMVPLAPSLDHIGCITRSAWDAAAVLECISVQDPIDAISEYKKKVPPYTKLIGESTVEKISVGIPKKYFFDYLEPEVEHVFYNFIDTIKLMDNPVYEEINLHDTEKYYVSWRDIRLAEAAEIHLDWLKTRPEDYGEDVRKMLIQGTEVPAVNYINALKNIKEIRNEFLKILKRVDVIIIPTTTLTAPLFDESIASNTTATISQSTSINGKVLEIREALLRNNIVFNITGLPAVTIPSGLTRNHMPVGVQIVGNSFEEEKILSIAYNYECLNDSLSKFIPPICQ
jgi:aspartyl-tRNA(Asn)/glutamyl-tRNA(Gln) amidotransferase subunit A